MPSNRKLLTIPVESRILVLRRNKVILDRDLAELYRVPVKRLNEQVKRNQNRFPHDFMFKLNPAEYAALRSQFATSTSARGGRRYLPYAFTEHGVIMAASVLNSKRAVEMSIFVVRAFVRLRQLLATNRQLAAKINELERRLEGHEATIEDVIDAIRKLMTPPRRPGRRIGFQLPAAKEKKIA